MQAPWKVIRIYLLLWLAILIILLVASIIRHWDPICSSLMGSVSQMITTGIVIAIIIYLLVTLIRTR